VGGGCCLRWWCCLEARPLVSDVAAAAGWVGGRGGAEGGRALTEGEDKAELLSELLIPVGLRGFLLLGAVGGCR
jgi:hypothetical protein